MKSTVRFANKMKFPKLPILFTTIKNKLKFFPFEPVWKNTMIVREVNLPDEAKKR